MEDLVIRDEETLDDLILGGLKIIQPKKGYRFSLDAVLLSHFCSVSNARQVVDLGTGNGVIPLLLTTRVDNLKITGIELQPEMVKRARRTVKINNVEDKIVILEQDINSLDKVISGGWADLVTCNPPFYKIGEGRISLNEEEAIARHEVAISMEEIIIKANYLLNNTGVFALIQRADRLGEIINLFTTYKFNLNRLRFVHTNINSSAKLFLIEGRKNNYSKLEILPPLIIYEADSIYSEEVKSWYKV